MYTDLNIIIPCKNEGKNLEFIIPKLLNYTDDITVVDGNSNDGTYAYMGAGSSGVQVFNVSDPNNPSFHAFIRTVSAAYETEISGNFLYVSDRTAGLKIYDISLIKNVSRWTNSGGDNLWSNTSNWAGNSLPTSSDDVTILNNSSITVDTGASIANLNIVPGGSLTINADSYLSINSSKQFSNAGTVTVNSNSTSFGVLNLAASANASGKITYNRWVNAVGTNEWDLIGSPVDGLDINTFVSDNSGVLATNGVQVAVGTYNNSNNDWSNYTTDGSGAGNINAAGNFDIGKGYQMGTVDGGTNILQFTGTIATADQLQAVINNNGKKYIAFNAPHKIKVQLAPCQNPLTKKIAKVFLTFIQVPPLLPPRGMYR